MSILEVYNNVVSLVESLYQTDLQSLAIDIQNMLKEGANPKFVQQEEDKRKREICLDLEANVKIGLVVEIFVASNYSLSDVEIAQMISAIRESNDKIPSLSKSSVGRYLTDKRIAKLYGVDIYKAILEARKNNLLAAKSKGGKTFAQNNVAIKDELGHFQGSTRK